MSFEIKDLGIIEEGTGLEEIKDCSDGFFKKGLDGVEHIYKTRDSKVEFICFKNHTLCYVLSAIGYPAYYRVKPVSVERPIKALLMDLDGTSVKSESFWMWIIEKSVSSLLNDSNFKLSPEDEPFVSGHSVSEHLQYCIDKYCPDKSLEEARKYYFIHTRREMNEIMEGRGKPGAFTPSDNLKFFLQEIKKMGIKLGLVTSGLYEKAWPEIKNAFDTIGMGDPKDFYDSIISAGFPLGKGMVGTLGELSPKPHPWLYAETCTVGLNIKESERSHVLGVEDSGAGVCSIRLAGFAVIGIDGGNIKKSGTLPLCSYYCNDLLEILDLVKKINESN